MRPTFPFAAIVGQHAMKTALLLHAVDPGVGGVLISGHKGTGKSTAVRALAALLPDLEVVAGCPYHCAPDDAGAMHDGCAARLQAGETLPRATRPMPLVQLPLSATEDRLVGTLHLESALRTGDRVFEPGLLAAANRGILFVDEVNLLDDHLVDMLLDSAASGVNVVEREGISQQHPSRFILVGTMNPEEGDLRPQLLDRFALWVNVDGVQSVADRMELVRRRTAFDRDPEEFCRSWGPQQESLRARLSSARDRVTGLEVPEDLLEAAVRMAQESGARGHRAELSLVRAARALCAWRGADRPAWEDLVQAAGLVLPHRMPDARLASPETLEQRVAELVGEAGARTAEADDEEEAESMQIPGSMAAGSILLTPEKKSPPS